jgi:AraC-like DNA-binding protein
LDRAALLRKIEVSEDQIRDPDSRIPVVKTLRLWRRIANELDDPDLGLEVGSTFEVREGGVVGYAMLYSDTLLGALRRVVRFAKLLNQRADLRLEDLGDRWRLQATHQPLIPDFRQPVDEGIAGLMACFREIVGREIVAASLYFNYPRPQDTTLHRRLLGTELHFAAPTAAIELWDRDVRAPTVAADRSLTRYLDELAQVHLQALPKVESYSARLRRAVWPHLSEGSPTIQQIAAELALSTRSLQRRLREEGTSFAEVIDGLRHDKAQLLLRDPNLAVYEVAYLLGYSDPSTFHRAFRRWEGTSPSRFRAQQIS